MCYLRLWSEHCVLFTHYAAILVLLCLWFQAFFFVSVGNEAVHFKLVQEQKAREEVGLDNTTSESEQSNIGETDGLDNQERFNILTDGLDEKVKILNLANQNGVKGTAPKTGFVCSSQKLTLTKSKRHIPAAPVKTLDAPDLSNDFYLNLMDWSGTNYLTVALGNGVYMWNASSGDIVDLVELDDNLTVTAVRIHDQSKYIAVGVSDGSVLIFDSETKQKIRSLRGHSQRVACLDWNGPMLCSGSRSGNILTHDTVSPSRSPVHMLAGHTQEVCALKWNTEKKLLASGSADASVKIWSLEEGAAAGSSSGDERFLINTLNGHIAAVKAMAWMHNSSNFIVTGGGKQENAD